MRRGAELGAAGVVVHAGHTVGAERDGALRPDGGCTVPVARRAPAGPRLLLELTAGARGAIASRIEQMGR